MAEVEAHMFRHPEMTLQDHQDCHFPCTSHFTSHFLSSAFCKAACIMVHVLTLRSDTKAELWQSSERITERLILEAPECYGNEGVAKNSVRSRTSDVSRWRARFCSPSIMVVSREGHKDWP